MHRFLPPTNPYLPEHPPAWSVGAFMGVDQDATPGFRTDPRSPKQKTGVVSIRMDWSKAPFSPTELHSKKAQNQPLPQRPVSLEVVVRIPKAGSGAASNLKAWQAVQKEHLGLLPKELLVPAKFNTSVLHLLKIRQHEHKLEEKLTASYRRHGGEGILALELTVGPTWGQVFKKVWSIAADTFVETVRETAKKVDQGISDAKDALGLPKKRSTVNQKPYITDTNAPSRSASSPPGGSGGSAAAKAKGKEPSKSGVPWGPLLLGGIALLWMAQRRNR